MGSVKQKVHGMRVNEISGAVFSFVISKRWTQSLKRVLTVSATFIKGVANLVMHMRSKACVVLHTPSIGFTKYDTCVGVVSITSFGRF